MNALIGAALGLTALLIVFGLAELFAKFFI